MAGRLRGEALKDQLGRVPRWEAVEEHHLRREFGFETFAQALAFVNKVAEIAEQQNHHPDVSFGWGRATVETFSHDAGGITQRDVELAAKIDGI